MGGTSGVITAKHNVAFVLKHPNITINICTIYNNILAAHGEIVLCLLFTVLYLVTCNWYYYEAYFVRDVVVCTPCS